MESLPEEEKQIEQPPAEGEAQEVKVEVGKELDLRRLKQLMKDTTDQFEKNELQIKQLTDSSFYQPFSPYPQSVPESSEDP